MCECRPSLTSSDLTPSVPPWSNPESRPSSGSVNLNSLRRILSTSSDFQLPSLSPLPSWGSWMWISGTLGDPHCSGISTLASTWKADLPWLGRMVSLSGQLSFLTASYPCTAGYKDGHPQAHIALAAFLASIAHGSCCTNQDVGHRTNPFAVKLFGFQASLVGQALPLGESPLPVVH